MGRAQAATYTGDFDTLTATQGTGTTSGTTTNTYGANTGQSITASTSQGGASGQAAYANTAANTKYLASSSTDDAGNQSLYTYNGAGNALTASDALAAKAALEVNPDGTVKTALAPGNGTNKTQYGYDTDHQLTALTPVAKLLPRGQSVHLRRLGPVGDRHGRARQHRHLLLRRRWTARRNQLL
ncbi:hypothetical protein ACOM2C_02430 [Pseudarthrobacter sp. So.54]